MDDPSRRGPFHELYAYMERRLNPSLDRPLPDLPAPGPFKQVFREWAEGRVNFTEPGREQEYTILARPGGAPRAEEGRETRPVRDIWLRPRLEP